MSSPAGGRCMARLQTSDRFCLIQEICVHLNCIIKGVAVINPFVVYFFSFFLILNTDFHKENNGERTKKKTERKTVCC